MDGASRNVLDRYLEARVKPAPNDPPGVFAEASRLAAVELLDEHGKPAMCYFPGDPITVAEELELPSRVCTGSSAPLKNCSLRLGNISQCVLLS